MVVRKINALLEYYCQVQDPNSLTDVEWAIKWHNLHWARVEESKHNPGPR